MQLWMYIVPVAVIVLLVVIMLPIMRKKSAKMMEQMPALQAKPVHLSMMAGTPSSINGQTDAFLVQVGTWYGIDAAGPVDVAFVPCFTYGNTTYTGKDEMHVGFIAEDGHTYEMSVSNKEPKNDPAVVMVVPISTDALIFKTKFYIVVKDITGGKDAQAMRGIY